MKVFFDHNLSPYLAHALKVLLEPEGDEIVHLTDRFAANTADQTWMTALGVEGGWTVISADLRIYRNRPERDAWRQSQLVIFFLTPQWRHAKHIEIAWRLLRLWPRIVDQSRIVAPPAAFELPFGAGRLRVLRR